MAATEEGLASWHDTPTRTAIVDFVDAVTQDGPSAVPPAEHVAVFDNDGTLGRRSRCRSNSTSRFDAWRSRPPETLSFARDSRGRGDHGRPAFPVNPDGRGPGSNDWECSHGRWTVH
jgi:hypothetical protein